MSATPPSPGDTAARAPSPAAASAPTAPRDAPDARERETLRDSRPERRIEEAPPAPEPFLKQLAGLFAEIPLLFSERVTLLALELRRAGLALAQMVGLVVGAAVFAATAWLGLWAGIAAALVKHDVGLGWVVLIVVGLNLAGAAWAVMRVKSLAPRLTLPATLRHLTFNPAKSAGHPTEPPAREQRPAAQHDADTLAAARTAADAVAAAARSAAPASAATATAPKDDHARHD